MSLPIPTKMLLRYGRRLTVGIDQFVNVVFGGNPGESISYRAAKAARDQILGACILCRLLGLVVKDHCEKTRLEYEKARCTCSKET